MRAAADRPRNSGIQPYTEKARLILQGHFEERENLQRLTGRDFVSILQNKVTLPKSIKREEAERIIFVMLVYLCDFPFPSKPSDFELLTIRLISKEELVRSLVWLFPGSYTFVIKPGSFTRVRTPADRRRLLFQSLASIAISDAVIDPAAAFERAKRNADDIPADQVDYLKSFVGVNYDSDGDEIFHDVLDVLFSVQDRPNPLLAPVRRDMFRDVAKSWPFKKEKVALSALGIPRKRFSILMNYLAVVHWYFSKGGDDRPADLSALQRQAEAYVTAFCPNTDIDTITWPMFDDAMRSLAHDVFDPLYQLLSFTLLGDQDWLRPLEM